MQQRMKLYNARWGDCVEIGNETFAVPFIGETHVQDDDFFEAFVIADSIYYFSCQNKG